MKTIIKKGYRSLRQLYNKSIKFNHIKTGVVCEAIWYGNQYGGFFIHPSLLDKQSIVYSFGIGEDISFDEAIIRQHGCNVFGFDPTPKSIEWSNKQSLPNNFQLLPYGIAPLSGTATFHLPKNNEHVSGSLLLQENTSKENSVEVEMQSFPDIIKILQHKKIDVLKMDIEGSEYDVIDSILNSNIPVTQMAIEFHERFFDDGKAKSKELIKKMKNHGYDIFAISTSYEEISFIKTDAL